MSTTSKKPKALSASSLTKLVNKHATRGQPAEKTSGTSRQTHKGNPELDAVPDQHDVLTEPTVAAEDYKMTKRLFYVKMSEFFSNLQNSLIFSLKVLKW